MIGVSDEYVALQITSSQNQGRIKQLFVLYIISYITINIYIYMCVSVVKSASWPSQSFSP